MAAALDGADAVIYCASTFGEGRTRLPERLDNFNRASAALGPYTLFACSKFFEMKLRLVIASGGRGASSNEMGIICHFFNLG